MNCNEKLRSSINLPVPLISKTNIVDLNSVLRLFFTSQLHKNATVAVKCSSSSDLHQFKIVKEKPEILFIIFERNRYETLLVVYDPNFYGLTIILQLITYIPTLPFWTGDSRFEKLSPVLPFDLEISRFEGNICKFSIFSKNSNIYRKLLRLLVF